jgi:hypothetical protein
MKMALVEDDIPNQPEIVDDKLKNSIDGAKDIPGLTVEEPIFELGMPAEVVPAAEPDISIGKDEASISMHDVPKITEQSAEKEDGFDQERESPHLTTSSKKQFIYLDHNDETYLFPWKLCHKWTVSMVNHHCSIN